MSWETFFIGPTWPGESRAYTVSCIGSSLVAVDGMGYEGIKMLREKTEKNPLVVVIVEMGLGGQLSS
jgi:Ni,Fe-hydrogenase maturation factor